MILPEWDGEAKTIVSVSYKNDDDELCFQLCANVEEAIEVAERFTTPEFKAFYESVVFHPEQVKMLLDGISAVPDDKWDQGWGTLYEYSEPGSCAACAAAWTAFFIEQEGELHDYISNEYNDGDGIWYLMGLLNLDKNRLDEVFTKHGASDTPFDTEAWSDPQYDVFSRVFEERLGFSHEFKPNYLPKYDIFEV